MSVNRREFLKKAALTVVAGAPFLSGCVKNGVSPFATYSIITDECIGCGDCVDACKFDTIELKAKTAYAINVEKCIECGQCIPFCEDEAFEISIIEYVFDEEKCIGCGKCIDECKNEGDVISYEKEYYSVRGKCRPNMCHSQCAFACPEDAITISDKSYIDLDKCTKCGDCVDACPRDAINPAKVEKEDDDCTHCGKCFDVCEFDVITKVQEAGAHAPRINPEICTSCGECREACDEYEAILWDENKARIIRNHCRDCGDCLDACTHDAVLETTR